MRDDLTALLQPVRELSASDGPAKLLAAVRSGMRWGWFDGEGYDPQEAADGLGAVLAAFPLLLTAVDAALEHHQPRRLEPYEHISWVPRRTPVLVCFGCRDDEGETTEWPCPTAVAITAALTGLIPEAS